MKPQRRCAAAQQHGAGGGGQLGAGGGKMPQGSWSSPCGRGTAPAAQGTEQSWLPASATAQSTGHGWQLVLQRALHTHTTPPRGKRQPRRAKTSPGYTLGLWGDKACPLKRGSGCTGAPSTSSPPAPLPGGDGAAPQAPPPFAASCPSGAAGHRPGPPLAAALRGRCSALGQARGARSCVSAGRRSAAGHGDARPVMGMLIPCTPTLCSQWSPARRGAGNVGKVFEKRVTAPQATGVAPGRTRTAESVSYKAPKMQTWFNKSPPPPQPCKTPAVKSGSALQQAH